MANNEQATSGKIKILFWPTLTFTIGLILVYIGERAIGEPPLRRWLVDGLGFVLLAAGLAGRARSATSAKDEEHRWAEMWMVKMSVLMLAGLALYFLFAVGKEGLRSALGKGFDRTEGVAQALWPALILLGLLPQWMMQRAMSSMTDALGEAEHVEARRVRYSMEGGLTVALVLIFCFAVGYVASERNVKYDLARFRSTRPSPASIKLVENLSKPVRAVIFMQSPNEVRELIVPYFADLAKRSSRFTYQVFDHALEPQKAKELGATGNGLIVIGQVDDKGALTQKETLHIGTTLETAGSALGTFDGDVQKRMLLITRPGRVAYFTVGHGERSTERGGFGQLEKNDLRPPVSGLDQMLRAQGFEVKTLGIGQGLSTRVPGDAGIVFIPGPTERFLPEEVNALGEYLSGGGHIFLMLDPQAEQTASDLAPLLKNVGLKYHPQILCNDEVFWVRTHQPSDHAGIAATSFSSHASMSTLSRASGRAAVVLPRSGWLERDGSPREGVQIDFTIRSMPKTWVDLNGNFTYDKDEKQQVYDLAAVASRVLGEAKDKKEMRLAVLGSVDAVSDIVLGNRANLVLALDTVKWLIGDEAIAAEVAQEQDLPIVHTKNEDKAWFYLTVFAAPALILTGGLLYSRHTRRARRRA